MLSSRNIHFAILGIILGATSGYILAFYQVQKAMPPPAPPSSAAGQQGHPNVTREQLLEMFNEALRKSPNDPTLMTRYANFLIDLGRTSEAVTWFEKVLTIQPENADVRTDLGAAYWNAGQRDKAKAEFRRALSIDPKRVSTMHNLVVAHLDERDFASAEKLVKQMEEIDPKYPDLETLKKRLAVERGRQ